MLTLARRGVAITRVMNMNTVISDYLNSPEFQKLQSYHLNVTVNINLADNLLNIKGSEVHLSKTIMNLVANAAESMPDGGTITISSCNQYVDIPIGKYDTILEGDYIKVAVADTGIGIPDKDLEKIFEPFYTKKMMGRSGTGLGMAVVWGTIKDHHGYIDVESIVDAGTKFTLYLPVTREELKKQKSDFQLTDFLGEKETILVVDDVKEQLDLAAHILTQLNYTVSKASSGEEAVTYLKENKVNLVILDMIMDPGMDGYDTYQKILEDHPGQKAIISSGYSETSRVKGALELGAGRYLKKPYTIEKMGMAVKEELQ